ncbi:electron transfer flavoprotein subunit alpha/FixB family protein [Acidimicrobiia bacterium EGI L10123]|uniref:electron transfer flavoprotein subunit alpha/FixB family protein n=1 Tax=Salinilacustrithrix flava TaxID=2957203 RepID=UPI003D7C182C|nr:electron transfer flavoprotein subunit alpha/FixB family protein [Acidimicrobiia bacterium EGI L10123]
MALSKVWVFAETDENGSLTTLSKELLTKARDLGDTVEAFYAGDGNDIAESAGAFGATAVHATGPIEGQLLGAPVGAALAAAAEGVDLVLGGTSYDARDAFAVASVKLDKPVISNTTAIDLDGDAVVTTVPVFGGEKLVKTKFTAGGPMLCLVRPKSYEASESGGGAASVSSVDVPGDAPSATVLATHVEEREGPQLDSAPIVVSGGRGLGDPAKFEEYIEALGKKLGAATGATRAIVDAGWVPYNKQVGQTGKVVKPDVYIAAGISGATQHLVGMKGSKNIIAINKDPEAPIFSVADLGIVGDVHKVLPALIEALNAKG